MGKAVIVKPKDRMFHNPEARLDTSHVNLEDAIGHLSVVEHAVFRLHDRCLSHDHLLALDVVEYGARGAVGLQRRHVCDVKHLKGN